MRKDRKKGTKDYDNKCGIANNCSSDYSGRDFFSSERKVLYASGVSPENERKFMITIGSAVIIIGLDMLVLALLSMNMKVSQETKLIILGIGLVLFVGVILIGQKYFRR